MCPLCSTPFLCIVDYKGNLVGCYSDPQISDRIYQLFLQTTPATVRFANEFSGDQIPLRSQAQAWRRYIYHRKLYAVPLTDDTNWSLKEAAEIHNLQPWFTRELNVLLENDSFKVNTIINNLPKILTKPISSFREFFRPYLGDCTDHFIHELYTFACSCYSMMQYDRIVRYAPH